MNKIRNVVVNIEYKKIYPYFLRQEIAKSHIWARQVIFNKVDIDSYKVTLKEVKNYPCLLSFFQQFGISKEEMIIEEIM